MSDSKNTEAVTVDEDQRWKHIKAISDAIVLRDQEPDNLESALIGAVWRCEEARRELAAANARAEKAEAAALRNAQDAERYRWIRNNCNRTFRINWKNKSTAGGADEEYCEQSASFSAGMDGVYMDAAIDAAIKSK